MTDLEDRFRNGLRQAVANQPPLGPIDVDEVIARGAAGAPLPLRRRAPRWLAVAAALALVVGIGVGAWLWRTGSAPVPAVPAAGGGSSAPLELAGTSWWAIKIEGQAVVASAKGVPRLEFDTATDVLRSDPCNSAEGRYELSGADPASLHFSGWGAQTDLGCEIAQQQRFEKALRDTRSARLVPAHGSVADDVLEFLDSDGTVVLQFIAGDGSGTPEPTTSPSATAVATGVPATQSPSVRVDVRVRNASGKDFSSVEILFPSNTKVAYGPLPAGASSDYVHVEEPVYGYAEVTVTVDGEQKVFQPTDYLGEKELPAGAHTYVLNIDARGQLTLTLE